MTQSNNPTGGCGALTANRFVSADATIIGRMPANPAALRSARAEVLARFLRGEAMTVNEALLQCSTYRLSAQVHALKVEWGWPIKVCEEAVPCSDGHVAYIARYSLDDAVIAEAHAAGAAAWCDEVMKARAHQRANPAHRRGAVAVGSGANA